MKLFKKIIIKTKLLIIEAKRENQVE